MFHKSLLIFIPLWFCSLLSHGSIQQRKIILLGNSFVGKTCILSQYKSGSYPQSSLATIGIDYFTEKKQYKDKEYRIMYWDTAGVERFRGITKAYLRGSDAIILTYSTTEKRSFDHISLVWLPLIEKTINLSKNDTIILLLGNKCDLTKNREVTYVEGQSLADKISAYFMEVSALNGTNIKNAFDLITQKVLEQKNRKKEGKINIAQRKKKNNCCK